MSDKRQNSQPSGGQAPTGAPDLRQRRHMVPGYWLLSILFHGTLLVWLLFFSPIRVIDLQALKRESTAGSEKISRVMDHIRERQADLLEYQVRELLAIERELNLIEAHKHEEFSLFLKDFSQDAPARALEAQAAAEKAQAEALAAQDAAEKALAAAQTANATSAWSQAALAQKEAQDAQWRALQSMERALQALTLGGPGLESARQAQADANGLQTQADRAQVGATASSESGKGTMNDAGRKQENANKAEQALQTAQAEAAEAKTKTSEASGVADQANEEYQKAKAAADQASAAASQPGMSKEEQKTAKAEADSSKRAAAQAQRAANDAANKLKSAERTMERANTKAQQAQEKLNRSEEEAGQAQAKADEAQAAAVKKQADAQALQAEAGKAQAKARQAMTSLAAGEYAGTAPAVAWDASSSAPVIDSRNLSLAELYQVAVTAESALTESYREVRATDLAMIRQIPLEQARNLTDAASTVRPDLAEQLRGNVTNAGDVPGMRQAVQTAVNEIGSMVALGQSLLALAKGFDSAGSPGADGASISLEGIYARAQQAEYLAGLAAEDPSARAKDLAAAMAGNGGTGPGQGGQAGRPAGGAAGGVGRGPGFGAGAGPGRPGGSGISLEPPHVPKDLRALASRKVRTVGQPAKWVFVDSWYILGPFDNAGRANIEKKFPPETVVDLDATYLGKDDQPLRWEFFQTPEPRIVPPFDHFHPERKSVIPAKDMESRGLEYIIYYAYTELYFEAAADLWIAVGSDDYSKLWIEDQLVWASGKQQKSWRVDEGFRRVHFKQGYNRVLYRVENGWHGTDFSLCIFLGDS